MTLTINITGGTKATVSETISPGTFAMGVNLSGMEYGSAGAVQNVNYVVPSLSELTYYKSQGVDLIRLPISWETLQTKLDGPLTASYLANIKTVLANAASLGMKVIIDLHNFGGYGGAKLGTASVTDAEFANLWKQLSAAVKGSTALAGYDLMNEPSNMPSATAWTTAAQAAITAIRTEDTVTPIYVEGNDYASAYDWSSVNPGLATLVDPSKNLVFSAHVYLDSDDSGTHFDWAQEAALGTTTETGVDRLENFAAWLKKYNLKGDIGEVGVGNDNPNWLVALNNTLAYAKANNLQTTYWAGGPWWATYPMSVEPQNGVAAAQMAVLDRYTGDYPTVTSVNLSGTAPPNSTVYLSENGVLLAKVVVPASGKDSGTLTGLANGVHTIIVSTTWPTADGTIAAVTFNLAAPAAAVKASALAVVPATTAAVTTNTVAAITQSTVTAAKDSSASMTFQSTTASVVSSNSAASVPATPQQTANSWRELFTGHLSAAALLRDWQELTHSSHAVISAAGSMVFGSTAELSPAVGIGSLLAGIASQT